MARCALVMPMKRVLWLGLIPAFALACTGRLSEEGAGSGGPGGGNPSSGEGPGGGGGTVQLPGGLKVEGKPSYYRVVRLTHQQWENSVRDVLLLPEHTGLSSGFSPDPPDGKFQNNERALYISDTLRIDYQRSAEAVAEMVAGDPAALARLGDVANPDAFIDVVARRAFRRDLEDEERVALRSIWDAGANLFEDGDPATNGARVFIEAVLQTPQFLFRVETSPDGSRLSGTELATKLSFLLRNTTPSDELLDLAISGGLDTDEGLASVVSSMLAEPASSDAVLAFHEQLFGLSRYRSILKNQQAFPTYTEALNDVLYEADRAFFNRLYTAGFGFREILTSNIAFVNDATAPFYGLTASGPELTEVTLGPERPGFLTRIGFLAYNATLNDPDPIHRGVDINNKILCAKLEPPPGEIPPLPDFVPGMTNRERVQAHTEVGACKGCHGGVINPPGFALENFDAMGQIRTTDNGQPVDTSGVFTILEGEPAFSNITELASILAENSVAHSCYVVHLAEYAFARDVGPGDTDLLTTLHQESIDRNTSIGELLLAMVTSPDFTTARTPNP
jgi:hypothetical protein